MTARVPANSGIYGRISAAVRKSASYTQL